MSVMPIKNETFNKVLNSLFFNYHWLIKDKMEQFKDYNKMKGLVETLRAAHHKSYQLRYKEELTQLQTIDYDSNTSFPNDTATLKALHAIRYNIGLPDGEFDFTFIDTAIKALTDKIIEELPEYKEALWG
ncbi:hypothetical protein [Paenibacillus sp. Y412MC10]|uniref:hypothetical protein n=1 Tax=Geobacillus sp. (strain Y412MC10) TaxID=481743 RepID=UPI0011A59925|nr:hypothetical protein [Paenibacillus sp. Y412MC10]